ncbi:hypothetical protein KIW84_075463 [Lathyrus oleraceus]|uniref:Uncharacterized protein n=1 Tax=Pisum sativum TaxID=3888 RepID=A0A9D5A1Y1_PEA|nr:hypothetical protein KIW84_075463 [Pisum sativum]
MRIDSNPMQPVEAHYVEPSIVNMVEVEVAPDGNFEMVEAAGSFDTNINMVEIADDLANQNEFEVTEGFDDQKKMETTEVSQRDQAEVGEDRRRKEYQRKEYQRLAYPKEEENLVEFIKRCQKMRTEVMLCPCCSAIFDRKSATNLEAVDKAKRKENWGTTRYDPRRSG